MSSERAKSAKSRRRGVPAHLLASMLLGLLLICSLLLAVAAPELAPSPQAAASGMVPPLPSPHGSPATARPFSDMVDHFPAVDLTVSDSSSRAAVIDYRALHLFDASGAAKMFRDAWQGVSVPTAAQLAVRTLKADLLSGQPPIGASLNPALATLIHSSGNVGRLNNVAVALYLLDAANYYSTPIRQVDGLALPVSPIEPSLQASASWLWQALATSAPPSHAVLVNYPRESPDLLRAWLQRHPSDTTIRLALAANEVDYQANGPARASATLRPLLGSLVTSAVGHSALGDVDLHVARTTATVAPYQSRRLARQALVEYDRALAVVGDPAAYAGRAQALDLLGEVAAATKSQQQAVARSTRPIDPLVALAYLGQKGGRLLVLRRAADRAYALAFAWNPQADAVIWTSPFGSSTTTFLAEQSGRDFIATPFHGGGGGGPSYELFDAIPRYDQAIIDRVRQSNDSAENALWARSTADLLTAPAQLPGDSSRWSARFHAIWNTPAQSFFFPRRQDQWLSAARWLAERQTTYNSDTLLLASNELRYAGLFGRAASLCAHLVHTAPQDPTPQRCVGESTFFIAQSAPPAQQSAGMEAAGAALVAAIQSCREFCLARANLQFEAAISYQLSALVRQATGRSHDASRDLQRADGLYRQAAAQRLDAATSALAWEKLGDLDLNSGHLRDAREDYAIAGSQKLVGQPGEIDGILKAKEQAFNNTGIAQLQLIQSAPDQKPDCAGHPGTCEKVLSVFDQARAIDTANPIFALNTGWAARLLGHEQEARAALSAATGVDPALFPAFNDLGVLEAEGGETESARRHFEAALAASPHYDLAAWNLGVLDMRSGLRDTAAGQAYLARAIRENRSLRGSELEFRTDERFYRYLAGADIHRGSSLGRSYGIAGAALGWIVLLLALYRVIRSFVTDKAGEKIADFWYEREPEWRKKLAAHLQRLKLSSPQWRWRSHPAWRHWEPWLITVPVLVLAVGLGVSRTSPQALSASLAILLIATGVAILTHESGHLLAAHAMRVRLSRGYWASGVSLALLLALLPIDMNTGPYLGHRVDGDQRHAWRVYLSGPLANLVVAGGCYALFLAQPLPLFRVMTQAQLAVCAYSLLPIKPLDGEELKHKPRMVLPVALIVTAASLSFVVGFL